VTFDRGLATAKIEQESFMRNIMELLRERFFGSQRSAVEAIYALTMASIAKELGSD
jgi:hypothetical protein